MTTEIQRIDSNEILSEVTIHNQVVYLAGQVPNNDDADLETQTREVFANIDKLLAQANSDKSKMLSVQVFVKDLADFPVINGLWEAWLKGSPKPVRATIQAELVNPKWRLEIMVIAAQNA